MNMVIVFDDAYESDSNLGCPPMERDLEDLLAGGVILIDKPAGPTSHQLTAWARDLLGLDRLGHGGTLDPFATGVLPMLSGRAVRITGRTLSHDKTYVAVLRASQPFDALTLEDALDHQRGRIYNVPPRISAVKVQVRTRRIDRCELLDVNERLAVVEIECEAGTYIRTMARDLGLILGMSIDLVELRRTRSGRFGLDRCVPMSTLADAVWLWREGQDDVALKRLIHPFEVLLSGTKSIHLRDTAVAAVSHGAPVMRPGIVKMDDTLRQGDDVTVRTMKGEVVAVASMKVDASRVQNMERGGVATPNTVLMDANAYPRGWHQA